MGESRAVSTFGGRKGRKTRSEADRARDREERERRRLEAAGQAVPEAVDPLLAAPVVETVPAAAALAAPSPEPAAPAPVAPVPAATPEPPAVPDALAPEESWRDARELHESPAAPSAWPPP